MSESLRRSAMTEQLLSAFLTVLLGVGGCLAYFYGSNALLDKVCAVDASNDERAIRNLKLQSAIRPWLFLAPALLLLTLYLIYPVFQTIWLSFHDKAGDQFVGFKNYALSLIHI
jgi:alpha-glucoside transport system permease protein